MKMVGLRLLVVELVVYLIYKLYSFVVKLVI